MTHVVDVPMVSTSPRRWSPGFSGMLDGGSGRDAPRRPPALGSSDFPRCEDGHTWSQRSSSQVAVDEIRETSLTAVMS